MNKKKHMQMNIEGNRATETRNETIIRLKTNASEIFNRWNLVIVLHTFFSPLLQAIITNIANILCLIHRLQFT